MGESDKLPLKRVELSLTKFNEVAIPHHLDLLRQHKVNIVKYEREGEWARVRGEQAHARRVASQLRALLAELDALRRRVRAADLPLFDRATQRARDNTLRAVQDYLGVIESSCRALVYSSTLHQREYARERSRPAPAAAGSAVSGDSVGVLPDLDDTPLLQLDHHELELRAREEALRGWGELAGEVRALHEAWQHVQAAALHQREHVAAAAGRVDAAADDVRAARAHLSGAERLQRGAWVAGGALAGALAGGPVGLLAGLKAGAAAAVAGSVLGCLGLRALQARAAAAAEPPAGEKAD